MDINSGSSGLENHYRHNELRGYCVSVICRGIRYKQVRRKGVLAALTNQHLTIINQRTGYAYKIPLEKVVYVQKVSE